MGTSRVIRVDGTLLTLDRPTRYAYPAAESQVVSVPEYVHVQVLPDSSLVAQSWSGQRGGILIFVAQDEVVVEGRISAEGGGFRGGAFELGSDVLGCPATSLQDSTARAGLRGEGIDPALYGFQQAGRGNGVQGGGGGLCSIAGGGGAVRFRSTGGTCPLRSVAGFAGISAAGRRGAEDGEAGNVSLVSGFP